MNPEELGDDVPGLARATEHIVVRMAIALNDLLDGLHDREWFEEEMRQTVRYFVWLYVRAAQAREEEETSETRRAGGLPARNTG